MNNSQLSKLLEPPGCLLCQLLSSSSDMHVYNYTGSARNTWMYFTSLQHPDAVFIHSTTFLTKHLRVFCLIQTSKSARILQISKCCSICFS